MLQEACACYLLISKSATYPSVGTDLEGLYFQISKSKRTTESVQNKVKVFQYWIRTTTLDCWDKNAMPSLPQEDLLQKSHVELAEEM